MYTKLLLLAAFLVLAPVTNSIGISAKKVNSKMTAALRNAEQPIGNDQQEATTFPIAIDFTGSHNPVHTSTSHCDDDGKNHHFHFSTLQKRRCKSLWCFVTKLILAIAHICILIMLSIPIPH
ncbi:MAG: hypothetical protein ABIQ56_06760 [Chitinophagaceae bacterium]